MHHLMHYQDTYFKSLRSIYSTLSKYFILYEYLMIRNLGSER